MASTNPVVQAADALKKLVVDIPMPDAGMESFVAPTTASELAMALVDALCGHPTTPAPDAECLQGRASCPLMRSILTW